MMRAARVLVLTVIWVALWGDLSVANVASGVLVALGIVVVFDVSHAGQLVVRPVHATRFALYFAYKLVESTIVVARTVISPRGAVHTGIVAVPLIGCSDAVTTLIADAISLTPGTLTIEVRDDPRTLYVHALDLRDVDRVQADIRTLHRLAVRAFGTAEALEGLDAADTQPGRER
jgi:multicomponent Na+:H+ antiporter subunit E